MKRTLVLLVFCSVCQAPETPDKSTTAFNTIYCDEESSAESGTWNLTKWFNKSRDYLWGKERCVCCCPTQNEDSEIAVRDVPPSNEKKAVCKACRKGVKKTGNCIGLTGCTCWFIITGFGRSVKELVLGCLGFAVVECTQAWHRRRDDCKGKEREVTKSHRQKEDSLSTKAFEST